MCWLVRRVFVVWITLVVGCSAAVTMGRLDQRPSELQRLGFELCDGEPCLKGLKPGMAWAKVQELIPDAKKQKYSLQDAVQLPSAALNMMWVEVIPTSDIKLVKTIGIYPEHDVLPFTAGSVIALYGEPCHVYGFSIEEVHTGMILQYPLMDIEVGGRKGDDDFRLQLNTPIVYLIMTVEDGATHCTSLSKEDDDLWQGFTSGALYLDHNLKKRER